MEEAHETKGKLGFEDPQNRTERAVERTAPFAFIAYTLVIVWYVLYGHGSRAAKLPSMPWYRHKAGVTFSDMLATLRRTPGGKDFLIQPQQPLTYVNLCARSSTMLPVPHSASSP